MMPASAGRTPHSAASARADYWPPVPRAATQAQPVGDRHATAGGLPFFVFQLLAIVLICRPQDYVLALVPLRLALVFTVLALVVTLFVRNESRSGLFASIETKLTFSLFAAMCIGIPFAINRRESFNYIVFVYVSNLIFYFLFIKHVNSVRRFRRLVFVLVPASVFFSLAGFANGQFVGGRFVTYSTMFDPNDIAFMSICLLPFGLAAMLGSFRATTKLLGLASVILAVLLALYTGSRGGLLGLGAMFLLFLLVGTPKVKKVHKLILLTVVVVAAIAVSDKLNVDRYMTLTDVGSDYNMSEEEGRLQVWKRGLQIFSHSPLTGVGVQGFWQAIGTMRADENLTPVWQAPHNSYIEILTDTGLLGAGPFLLLILTCIKRFNGLRGGSFRDADLNLLPGIFLVGFVGLLVAAFFLSQAYSLPFTLYFAVSAALNGIAGAERRDLSLSHA